MIFCTTIIAEIYNFFRTVLPIFQLSSDMIRIVDPCAGVKALRAGTANITEQEIQIMKGICVRSEIKPLKKVLLHRPGRELLHLTPDRLPELLFDDIPFLKVAQQEHDAFAQILRSNGTEVVYLEDLMAEVLKLHPEQTKPFLYQWLSEGNIKTRRWQDKLYEYLIGNFEGKALVEKTMEGITLKEMGGASAYSLQDLIAPADDLINAATDKTWHKYAKLGELSDKEMPRSNTYLTFKNVTDSQVTLSLKYVFTFSYPDPNRENYYLDDSTETVLEISARNEGGVLIFNESGVKGKVEFGHKCLWLIIDESTDQRFPVGNHCYEKYSPQDFIS